MRTESKRKSLLVGATAVAIAVVTAWLWIRETPDKCLSSDNFLDCKMEITK